MSPARRKRSGRLRRFAEFAFDAVLAGGTIARWSYRCGLHGRLGVTEYDVAIAPGPALPRPLKIAFASDFHAGPTTHPQLLARPIRGGGERPADREPRHRLQQPADPPERRLRNRRLHAAVIRAVWRTPCGPADRGSA